MATGEEIQKPAGDDAEEFKGYEELVEKWGLLKLQYRHAKMSTQTLKSEFEGLNRLVNTLAVEKELLLEFLTGCVDSNYELLPKGLKRKAAVTERGEGSRRGVPSTARSE